VNTNVNYQVFYTQIVEKYPKLSPEQHEFFANLYIKWLEIVDINQKKQFAAGFNLIVSAVENKRYWATSIAQKMIQRWMVPKDHKFTITLLEILKEIDKIWQEKIAKIKQETQQIKQETQQSRERQQQIEKETQQYKKLTEMLKSFKNR